jgi:hypothetical protein
VVRTGGQGRDQALIRNVPMNTTTGTRFAIGGFVATEIMEHVPRQHRTDSRAEYTDSPQVETAWANRPM